MHAATECMHMADALSPARERVAWRVLRGVRAAHLVDVLQRRRDRLPRPRPEVLHRQAAAAALTAALLAAAGAAALGLRGGGDSPREVLLRVVLRREDLPAQPQPAGAEVVQPVLPLLLILTQGLPGEVILHQGGAVGQLPAPL